MKKKHFKWASPVRYQSNNFLKQQNLLLSRKKIRTKLDFLFLAQKPYKLSNQLPNPNIYFWPILAYKYQSINFIKLRFTKKKKKYGNGMGYGGSDVQDIVVGFTDQRRFCLTSTLLDQVH